MCIPCLKLVNLSQSKYTQMNSSSFNRKTQQYHYSTNSLKKSPNGITNIDFAIKMTMRMWLYNNARLLQGGGIALICTRYNIRILMPVFLLGYSLHFNRTRKENDISHVKHFWNEYKCLVREQRNIPIYFLHKAIMKHRKF